ncbi:MAG: hypothetical protein JNL28_09970 [Planctomycetes bacterium]|nr:hypothetical protein [Planctomycetota bacterium]
MGGRFDAAFLASAFEANGFDGSVPSSPGFGFSAPGFSPCSPFEPPGFWPSGVASRFAVVSPWPSSGLPGLFSPADWP